MATLVKNVYVDGRWYGPAYGNADQVPEDVAVKIANPKAWGEEGEASPAGESATAQEQPGDAPSRPAKSDPKAAWVDFAVSQGVDRAEAEGSSKADLVAAFGE